MNKNKRPAARIAFFAVIILFFTTNTFGQGPGKWDSWQKANCYSGISFSVVNMGYSKNAGGYLWGIRLRNDYDMPVTFSYKLTIGEEYKGEYGFDVTKNLSPGEIWTDGGDLFTAKLFKSPSTNYFYRIKNVCFNNPYCDKKCFAECDLVAGKANHQDDCAGNSSAQKGTQRDSGESISTDKSPVKEKIGKKTDNLITVKPEKNKSIVITSGTWTSMESKAIINVTEGGLMFERINNVDNGTQFYKKKSVNQYEWIDPDGAYNCLLTVRSSKNVEHFCNGYSLGEYEFLPSISDKNKSATAGSTLEADIKKVADYLCKMQVLEEKLNKNENDIKVQEEYRKISEELINFTTKLEAKYGEEVLDSEKAKKIALEEWKKCPVKVIIN